MIKQIGPKTTLLRAKDLVMAFQDMPGLVLACVEPDGKEFRCISYWDIEGEAGRNQRDIPCFYAPGYSPANA